MRLLFILFAFTTYAQTFNFNCITYSWNSNYDFGTVPAHRVLSGNLVFDSSYTPRQPVYVYIDTYNDARAHFPQHVLDRLNNVFVVVGNNSSAGSFSYAYAGYVSWHDGGFAQNGASTLVHELGHVLHFMMDDVTKERIVELFNSAVSRYMAGTGYPQVGLALSDPNDKNSPLVWDGVTAPKQLETVYEYMATGIANYYGADGGDGTIDDLSTQDSDLYQLLTNILN